MPRMSILNKGRPDDGEDDDDGEDEMGEQGDRYAIGYAIGCAIGCVNEGMGGGVIRLKGYAKSRSSLLNH